MFILLDDEEDEEDEAYYTDAFDGMKQRMTTLNGKTDKMEKVTNKSWLYGSAIEWGKSADHFMN